MDFNDVLTRRASIREYKSIPVEKEKIEKLIQAIISAPSAGNLQAYRIYIVENKEMLHAFKNAAWNQDYVRQSNLCFVFCALPEDSGREYGPRGSSLYAIQDTTIAAAYMQLAATHLGLSTVWIGAFDENKIKEIIKIPDNEVPLALIPVGYANETAYPTPRKPLEKVFRRIK